ncbi:MAG: Crp/Fnr family transcriptional regulator [Alphaproteobacteria bacterium]|nr:Crp/Fnr family transcriptional regulator [Alphaproteobacteria bacterium]
MPTNDGNLLEPLVSKLGKLVELSSEDRAAVLSLPFTTEEVRAGRYLIRERLIPERCCLLLQGFACRSKMSANGGRQIVSFHLQGDLLDVQHLLLRIADHNVETITDVVVAWIPKVDLSRLAFDHPNIGRALWRDSLIDASIFREWVLNVGRRDAKVRIAHMLCEFAARCIAAGLGSAARFELPMTQEQIGDATGLTPVHVNRMLRVLAEDGVIARVGRTIKIADWDRMRDVADFDATYLHAAA